MSTARKPQVLLTHTYSPEARIAKWLRYCRNYAHESQVVPGAYVPYVVILTTIYLLPLKLALLSQLLEESRKHSAAFVTADAYICLHLMIKLLHLQ